MDSPLSSPSTEWLHQGRVGMFLHYLSGSPGTGPSFISLAEWNRQVESVDVEALADRAAACGVGYVFITLGQNSGWFCTPNALYDKLSGHSESRCSRRDLPLDLGAALKRRGIDLGIYISFHGPCSDPVIFEQLYCNPYLDEDPRLTPADIAPFAEKQRRWVAVAAEWGRRYSGTAKGWWVDGCYLDHARRIRDASHRHPHASIEEMAAALRDGNPNIALAFNGGVVLQPEWSGPEEDYTSGEVNEPMLTNGPDRWIGPARVQAHVFSYLGRTWRHEMSRFSDEQVASITARLTAWGGALTWDVPVDQAGRVPDWAWRQLTVASAASLEARQTPHTCSRVAPEPEPEAAPTSPPPPVDLNKRMWLTPGTDDWWRGQIIDDGQPQPDPVHPLPRPLSAGPANAEPLEPTVAAELALRRRGERLELRAEVFDHAPVRMARRPHVGSCVEVFLARPGGRLQQWFLLPGLDDAPSKGSCAQADIPLSNLTLDSERTPTGWILNATLTLPPAESANAPLLIEISANRFDRFFNYRKNFLAGASDGWETSERYAVLG